VLRTVGDFGILYSFHTDTDLRLNFELVMQDSRDKVRDSDSPSKKSFLGPFVSMRILRKYQWFHGSRNFEEFSSVDSSRVPRASRIEGMECFQLCKTQAPLSSHQLPSSTISSVGPYRASSVSNIIASWEVAVFRLSVLPSAS
jgi:hypothetical protein